MAVTSVQRQALDEVPWLSRVVYKIAQLFINFQCQKRRYPTRFPLKLLQYSAERGDTRAMSGLGRLLYRSGACRADKRSGIEYVRRAAKRNDTEAQFVLGQAYLDDDIFNQKNKQLAIHWLALAADKGHTQASQKLRAIAEQDSSPDAFNAQPTAQNTSEKASKTLESA